MPDNLMYEVEQALALLMGVPPSKAAEIPGKVEENSRMVVNNEQRIDKNESAISTNSEGVSTNRAGIASASASADQAWHVAENAQNGVNNLKERVGEVKSIADQALGIGNEGNERSKENEEKSNDNSSSIESIQSDIGEIQGKILGIEGQIEEMEGNISENVIGIGVNADTISTNKAESLTFQESVPGLIDEKIVTYVTDILIPVVRNVAKWECKQLLDPVETKLETLEGRFNNFVGEMQTMIDSAKNEAIAYTDNMTDPNIMWNGELGNILRANFNTIDNFDALFADFTVLSASFNTLDFNLLSTINGAISEYVDQSFVRGFIDASFIEGLLGNPNFDDLLKIPFFDGKFIKVGNRVNDIIAPLEDLEDKIIEVKGAISSIASYAMLRGESAQSKLNEIPSTITYSNILTNLIRVLGAVRFLVAFLGSVKKSGDDIEEGLSGAINQIRSIQGQIGLVRDVIKQPQVI